MKLVAIVALMLLTACQSSEPLRNKDCPETTVQQGFCTGCCDLKKSPRRG